MATAIANADARTEVTASRARIVAASDAARRRFERDLHDGAQQRLVSLGLQLRTAEALLPPGFRPLREQLSDVVAGLTGVSEDLQEISRGIHPAILSRGGLGPALKTRLVALPSRWSFTSALTDGCPSLPKSPPITLSRRRSRTRRSTHVRPRCR